MTCSLGVTLNNQPIITLLTVNNEQKLSNLLTEGIYFQGRKDVFITMLLIELPITLVSVQCLYLVFRSCKFHENLPTIVRYCCYLLYNIPNRVYTFTVQN